jgi:hypothetical protein
VSAGTGPSWRLVVCLLLALPGRAPAQVDPSGDWRTLHTPHFRVHFRPAYRAAALLEAREAERAWALLATELHPPRGVVDLTLGDDVDASNGFTTVEPSSRIVIFAPPPIGDHGLLFYDSWLRLVTTHELTHVFHLDRARSFWGVLQRVFGRVPGLFPNEYQPSWVTEGIATYYESRFTNGGRVRGSFHTQLLAADRAAGASRSPWNALFFSRWPDGVTPYAYGSRFFWYLAGAAGDSAVPRLVEATAGQLIPFRVGRQVARAAPGHSLAADWAAGTQPAPLADARAGEERVLAAGLWTEPVPRVSPDGRLAAYVWDDAAGAREVRVLETATFRPVAAHRVNGGVTYAWCGDTLVIAQLDFTDRWRVRSDLYRWVPGGSWRRVTRGARLVAPAAGGGRFAALALAPATSRPTVPVPGPEDVTWTELVPSPDGRTIAGIRNSAGRWALVRWPADSADAAQVLLESGGTLTDLVWTASGDLWFVADPGGWPQVYRWLAPGVAEPLTAEPLGARAPAPLPDGALLYAALGARGWELRRAAPRAGAAPVTFTASPPLTPAPPVAVRETGYALWPSLRPHFWVPLVLDAGPTGRFAGLLTAGSDAIGRFAYAADGLLAPSSLRAAGGLVVVSNILGNPALDVEASSEWLDLLPPPGAPVTLSELDQNVALGASLVTQRWRSSASVRVAAEYEGTRFAARPDTALVGVCPGCVAQDLVGGSITLALSRAVVGALSISPEDGFAWTLTYRRRDEQGTPRWSNEVRSRLALYLRVPGPGGFAHDVLAVRLAAGAAGGPLGGTFKIGGVSSGSIAVTALQGLGTTRLFPVRGYRYGALQGPRAVTASAEYRAPLALLGRSLGHLPLGADKTWLTVFADAGDAWAPGAAPRLTRLASAGLELAASVMVGYDFALGIRLGIAQPLAAPPGGGPRRPQGYAALASDF